MPNVLEVGAIVFLTNFAAKETAACRRFVPDLTTNGFLSHRPHKTVKILPLYSRNTDSLQPTFLTDMHPHKSSHDETDPHPNASPHTTVSPPQYDPANPPFPASEK